MNLRAPVAGWLFAVFSALGCVFETGGDPLPGTVVGGNGGGGGGEMGPPPGNAIKVDGSWVNVTGNLAGMASTCGTLSMLSARPDRDVVIAGVITQGLYAIRDGAEQWTKLGQGAGSDPFTHGPTSIFYDPVNPGTFWEAGIYGSNFGVYKTTDDGVTFKGLGTFFHNDAVSVDLTDPQRKTLLAGTHEQGNKLYLSGDAGATWKDIGANLPAGSGFSVQPHVIDSSTFLLGTYSGAMAGVFRSTDAGTTWTRVYDVSVRNTPLVASDQSIYWLLDQNQGLIRSTDKGMTWTRVTGPGMLGTSGFYGGWLIELPDGRLVVQGTRYLALSADRGATWRALSVQLPWEDANAFAYSKFRKAFYISHFACGAAPVTVQADAIMRLDFDHTKF